MMLWLVRILVIALMLAASPVLAQKIYPVPEPVVPSADVPEQPVFVIRPPVRQMPSVQSPEAVVSGTQIMPGEGSGEGAPAKTDNNPVDQKIGQSIRVQAIDLPVALPMKQGVKNPPARAMRPSRGGMALADGFVARPWVQGLHGPRTILPLPSGDVVVSEPAAGRVVLVRDSDGDGAADRVGRLADRLNYPTGLAMQSDGIYVADLDRVWRVPLFNGQPRPGVPPQPVTPPGGLGIAPTQTGEIGDRLKMRPLLFAPDGKKFYVGVGASAPLAETAMPAASVQEFSRDGQVRRSFAYGLFSPQSLVSGPDAGLFALVRERDGMGPSLVPDFMTSLADGGFYGWPYAWLGPNQQPEWGGKRPDLVAKTIMPDQLLLAHSNPADMVWYQGDQFPDRWRNGMFISLAGSWDRRHPVGYGIAFVPFRDGKPDGSYEIFASGFWLGDVGPEPGAVWGRPAGMAVLADGSLLVADMLGGTIWRISYP